MTISADAINVYEQELMAKAEVLALALSGLHTAAPERAIHVVDAIAARLRQAVGDTAATALSTIHGDGGERARGERTRRPAPVVLVARSGGADEIEDFIVDILAENPPGLSVQDIVDNLDIAQIEIKRKTLVVRLHRMVQAGRLSAQAHGHYVLSEAERSSRRA
jgi:hypothetical protein